MVWHVVSIETQCCVDFYAQAYLKCLVAVDEGIHSPFCTRWLLM